MGISHHVTSPCACHSSAKTCPSSISFDTSSTLQALLLHPIPSTIQAVGALEHSPSRGQSSTFPPRTTLSASSLLCRYQDGRSLVSFRYLAQLISWVPLLTTGVFFFFALCNVHARCYPRRLRPGLIRPPSQVGRP
ncbi:hypothetical protein LX36DRAFT_126894 [Colletotrichum falcatum]|nr:hypothetical protein LX36DRAFT_126894 [Colletotrichum falcatum]